MCIVKLHYRIFASCTKLLQCVIAEDELRTKHVQVYVNTNNMALAEIYSITLWLGHLSDQTGICTGQHQKYLDDVRL